MPIGLAAITVLVIFVLDLPFGALVGIFIWLGAVGCLVASIIDLETAVPGKNMASIKYSEHPVVFVIATIINILIVAGGIIWARSAWRTRAA
jgi:hypothetical protein